MFLQQAINLKRNWLPVHHLQSLPELLLLLERNLFFIFCYFGFEHRSSWGSFFCECLVWEERSIFIFFLIFPEPFRFGERCSFFVEDLGLIDKVFARPDFGFACRCHLANLALSQIFDRLFDDRSLGVIFFNAVIIWVDDGHFIFFLCFESVRFWKRYSFGSSLFHHFWNLVVWVCCFWWLFLKWFPSLRLGKGGCFAICMSGIMIIFMVIFMPKLCPTFCELSIEGMSCGFSFFYSFLHLRE